jgi:hypothetical protein
MLRMAGNRLGYVRPESEALNPIQGFVRARIMTEYRTVEKTLRSGKQGRFGVPRALVGRHNPILSTTFGIP